MLTTEQKLENLRNQKCSIGDCNEPQGMFISIPDPSNTSVGHGMPFCMEHAMKLMMLKPKWERNGIKVAKILQQSDGSTTIINNHSEFLRRIKPEFLEIGTAGLELTKGKCMECGAKAEIIKTFLTPVCDKCYGYPRKVFKCALK